MTRARRLRYTLSEAYAALRLAEKHHAHAAAEAQRLRIRDLEKRLLREEMATPEPAVQEER